MALSELTADYPLFDWEASNGTAGAGQTRAAYEALSGQGLCGSFAYAVWNDMVDALGALQQALGASWDSTYASFSAAHMKQGDTALTDARFNAFRRNLDTLWRPGWPWALGEKPQWLRQEEGSFLGREDVRGTAQMGEKADIVYGWYLLELVRKLNILIRALRGDDVVAEFTAQAREKSRVEAGVLPAEAVMLTLSRASQTARAVWILAAWAVGQTHRGESRTAQSFRALLYSAVPIRHAGRWETDGAVRAILARAVKAAYAGAHRSRYGAAGAAAEAAAFGTHRGAWVTEDFAAGDVGTPLTLGARSPGETRSDSLFTAFPVEKVLPLGGEAASRSRPTAALTAEDAPVELRARNAPRFRCEAGMAAFPAGSGMAGTAASKTGTGAVLRLDGDEAVWLAPVRRGSDLYIRSVWNARQESTGQLELGGE